MCQRQAPSTCHRKLLVLVRAPRSERATELIDDAPNSKAQLWFEDIHAYIRDISPRHAYDTYADTRALNSLRAAMAPSSGGVFM